MAGKKDKAWWVSRVWSLSLVVVVIMVIIQCQKKAGEEDHPSMVPVAATTEVKIEASEVITELSSEHIGATLKLPEWEEESLRRAAVISDYRQIHRQADGGYFPWAYLEIEIPAQAQERSVDRRTHTDYVLGINGNGTWQIMARIIMHATGVVDSFYVNENQIFFKRENQEKVTLERAGAKELKKKAQEIALRNLATIDMLFKGRFEVDEENHIHFRPDKKFLERLAEEKNFARSWERYSEESDFSRFEE